MEECQADLDFIMALPGKKILLRGNHDMFWDVKKTEKLNEMFKGELERLRCSFEAAKAVGYEKFIMFLHYPPTSIGEMESPFTLMAQEYGAEKVIYSHCHGKQRYDDSFKGLVNGIEYKLVSGDYLNFKPELILR